MRISDWSSDVCSSDLEDILEEIVGEFTTDLAATSPAIHPQEDGTYVIDGSAHLRDINRTLDWTLPTGGPRTLKDRKSAAAGQGVSVRVYVGVRRVIKTKKNFYNYHTLVFFFII